MDQKATYFVKKIEEAINNGQLQEAQLYYNKACSIMGEIPEINIYKKTIEDWAKNTKPTISQSKHKLFNKFFIIASVVVVGIIGIAIYYFTVINPQNHLKKQLLSSKWYQGDVSSYNSDGIMLEFKSKKNYDFEILYKQYEGMSIAEFECQVLNGRQISVDGHTINVRFEDDGEKIIFSPSFVDLSEESIWKKYSSFGGNEPFYIDDSLKNNKNNKIGNSKKTTSNSEEQESIFTEVESTESENNSSEKAKKNNFESTNNVADTKTNGESKPSFNSTIESKSSSTTKSEPNDPCANGHSWLDATCTKPKTCEKCEKTIGSALGHDMYYTKCNRCGCSDFSNYTLFSNTFCLNSWLYSGTGSTHYLKDEEASINIDKSGKCNVVFDKYSYTFDLVQDSFSNSYDSLCFKCYLNGKYLEHTTVTFYYSQNRCSFFSHSGDIGFSQIVLEFDK